MSALGSEGRATHRVGRKERVDVAVLDLTGLLGKVLLDADLGGEAGTRVEDGDVTAGLDDGAGHRGDGESDEGADGGGETHDG